MKKTTTVIALALGVISASAQDLTSKKGEPYLPEAGDYAVSVDATPFLYYAGNFFGKSNFTNNNGLITSGNPAPTWNFLNGNNTISGKYFVDANTAYRLGLRLGFGGNKERRMVASLPTTTVNTYPEANATVENMHKQFRTNVGITAGIEKRRGKTRLQGFYGADAGIFFSSVKDKYTYGNALAGNATPANAVNVTAEDDFTGNLGASNTTTVVLASGQAGAARALEAKSGATFSFGVRAFIGAEYFIIPKLSLGGEFGWGVGLSLTGKAKSTYESVGLPNGATNTVVGETNIEGGKASGWGFDTDSRNGVFGPNASLRVTFHF
eukprot:TRINITY_DN66903_c0_g1_i1.p1 TRINITY_DN66903_c0_g1~~TRINITY_DN66903_c0_g1_i1.p1  ORF type:complete len:324 (-),score=37.93 TRINITY_DN66903_c0_g1_i1:251-1222(-)